MPDIINTGVDAHYVPGRVIDSSLFGHRYVGFRGFDRFEGQVSELHNGLIGWPGGYLAEDRTDLFGLEYADTGLAAPGSTFASINQVMEFAVENGHGLAVTLPTMLWHDDLDGLRAQTRLFMENLLGGTYGAVPDHFVIELGSEYYGHAAHIGMTADEMAPLYGEIVTVMIEEITAVRDDPARNLQDVDVLIGVQGGRDEEAVRIYDSMSTDALSHVDYVLMSRLPTNVSGVDWGMPTYEHVIDEWSAVVEAARGAPPEILLISFNVASPTRSEALQSYITTMADNGQTVTVTSAEMQDRTNTEFEQFWQDRIERFDLGLDHPRVLMELFSEFHAAGMSAGISFGTDQIHPGRLSLTDNAGQDVSFMGMDFLHYLYDSIDGTTMLEVSTQNSAGDAHGVYAFEGGQHTTIFVMGNDTTGDVTLNIEGLSDQYRTAYVDTLTPQVSDDWMDRFGIVDNPNVDETPEAETYAEGVEGTQVPQVDGSNLTVRIEEPGQVIRIVLTHSVEGDAAVSGWVFDPLSGVDLPFLDDAGTDPDTDPDPELDTDPDVPVDAGGSDAGIGAIFLLLLPLLALAGLG